jgi:DNA-3-methyladenine glycosylase
VEVEAYRGPDDLASHARFGPSKRNAVMFGSPGVAYVYLVYGMYNCLNVVVEAEGRAAAVLIRAVEPLRGIDEMRSARSSAAVARAAGRGTAAAEAAARRVAAMPASRLAAGPGLVCAAFSVDRDQTGRDLCDAGADLRLERDEAADLPIESGPRIGIDYAAEPWLSLPWRFFVPGNAALSTGSSR